MFKNLFIVARRGLNVPTLYNKNHLVYFRRATFIDSSKDQLDTYTELKYLSKLVGATYYKHNDEVEIASDVRLVDDSGRFLGIYSVNEAKKKCRELNTDLVLVNPNTKPAICKAMNYKEDLYKKFIKEVAEKDLPKMQKAKAKVVQIKSLKLGAKMTISDLKTKISTAQDMAKKYRNVRIYMQAGEGLEENGKNVISTFKDMTRDFLRATGDIREGNDYEEEEENAIEPEDDTSTTLVQEFESLIFVKDAPTEMKDFTEQDIRDMIQGYIKREAKRSDMLKQMDQFHMKHGEELKGQFNPVFTPEEEQFGLNLYADITPEDQKVDNFLGDIAKKDPAEAQKLTAAIEEARQRLGGSREEAMNSVLFGDRDKRLDMLYKIQRMKDLWEKRREL